MALFFCYRIVVLLFHVPFPLSTTLPRIAGIDEAGRGPWAGPVVAACVYLPEYFPLEGLGDSKQLSLRQRELLYTRIVTHAHVSLGMAEAYEIDTLGIKKATHNRAAFSYNRSCFK